MSTVRTASTSLSASPVFASYQRLFRGLGRDTKLDNLKSSLLLASAASGLEQLLTPVLGWRGAETLSKQWHAGENPAREQVDKFLNDRGLTLEAITAQTLSKKLDDFERIDRIIANAEARRHVVLREIDRHRAAVAARLRAVAEVIEEGEFEEVPEPGARQVRLV